MDKDLAGRQLAESAATIPVQAPVPHQVTLFRDDDKQIPPVLLPPGRLV